MTTDTIDTDSLTADASALTASISYPIVGPSVLTVQAWGESPDGDPVQLRDASCVLSADLAPSPALRGDAATSAEAHAVAHVLGWDPASHDETDDGSGETTHRIDLR